MKIAVYTKIIKIFTIMIALLIAGCFVIKYVDLKWWHEYLNKNIFTPKREIVEIYTYKDKKGITIISDKSVPEEYQPEADKIGTHTRESSK
jgi:hypothetical protein